jgi:hypothetical protein
MPERKRILVLAATAHDARPLRESADKLALETILGCSDDTGTLRLNFATRDSALHIVEYVQQNPIVAIIPVGVEPTPSAARAASIIGIPFHPPRAADVCADKALLRRKLCAPELITIGGSGDSDLTLHCIMTAGKLRVLAVIHKCPDLREAMVGGVDFPSPPVTFKSLPPEIQSKAVESLKKLISTLGLKHGPVSVDFSTRPGGVSVTNISLCYLHTDALHFRIPLVDAEISYAEVIIRNALDLDTNRIHLDTK